MYEFIKQEKSEKGIAKRQLEPTVHPEKRIRLSMRVIPRMSGVLSGRPVVQRTTANIRYKVGEKEEVFCAGEAVGLGGIGGVSHSEQKIWNSQKDRLLQILREGEEVSIIFEVDERICDGCRQWFEKTVYRSLSETGGKFSVIVKVGGNEVELKGGETVWTAEVAFSSTWNRIDEYKRMIRFMKDKRDEDGRLVEDLDQEFVETFEALDLNRLVWGKDNEFKMAVEKSFQQAKEQVDKNRQGVYSDEALRDVQDMGLYRAILLASAENAQYYIPQLYQEGYEESDSWEYGLTDFFYCFFMKYLENEYDTIQTPY